MSKKLGRGLADLGLTELLSNFNNAVTTSASTTAAELMMTAPASETPETLSLQELPLNRLIPGRFQPRQHFDETTLIELADSIKRQGIIQPLIVRPLQSSSTTLTTNKKSKSAPGAEFTHADNLSLQQFEIVAGERRWRAAKLAELSTVPVIIKSISDQDTIALGLIENIQRQDLNVLEEAEALHRLLNEFKLTHQAVAEAVGKSRTTISNLLRLLNLHDHVKHQLASQRLEMGHARALLALPLSQQAEFADLVVAQGLSVRATEERVRQHLNTAANSNQSTKTSFVREPKITSLQSQLGKKLNTQVAIKHQCDGKGRLIIHYQNWEKLNHILKDLELL